jgi:ubiquitin-conjugating enzyme E2 J2
MILILQYVPRNRVCISLLQSWNPVWSVGTILVGLLSFMVENEHTAGAITTEAADKKQFAKNSLAFNVKNKQFARLFPELVELLLSGVKDTPGLALPGVTAASSQATAGAAAKPEPTMTAKPVAKGKAVVVENIGPGATTAKPAAGAGSTKAKSSKAKAAAAVTNAGSAGKGAKKAAAVASEPTETADKLKRKRGK